MWRLKLDIVGTLDGGKILRQSQTAGVERLLFEAYKRSVETDSVHRKWW